MTQRKYLEADEASERPVEWIGGALVEREGASVAHCQIATRLMTLLRSMNRETFGSLMRVHIEATGENFYPDIATFDAIRMHPTMPDTLVNPVAVAEILSPTTQICDRENKLYSYRQIPSVQDVLLISADRVLIHHYARFNESRWRFTDYHWRHENIELISLNTSIPLAEIYRDIETVEGLTLAAKPTQ